jgi:predicted phage terminase large subunit-like protein
LPGWVLEYLVTVERNPWIPQRPHPRQQQFLLHSRTLEALYGGAAGGGKSSALLMAAAQYVERPGYAALILRENFADLSQPDGLIPRSKEWWHGRAQWNEEAKRWTFPSGASITFGYLERDDSVYQYQGAAYQFIAIDELTQHTEFRYRYLFSRLRRLTGSDLPLRMRAASNPGGKGHEWVKQRFLVGRHAERVFVPAKLSDNPSLDAAEYLRSLDHLDPLTRAQLLAGDWDAVAGGRFQREWFRAFSRHGTGYNLAGAIHAADTVVRRFLTVDTAASAKTAADWTVISSWLLLRSHDLLWTDMRRGHWEIPDIPDQIADAFAAAAADEVVIEGGGTQKGVYQLCQRHPRLGYGACREWIPKAGQDKLVRATPAINLAAAGKLWVPAGDPPWLAEALGELIRFTGDEKVDAHDDIVDTVGMAAAAQIRREDSRRQDFRPYVRGS